MKSVKDRIMLHNEYEIPCVGYGTYKALGKECETSVSEAIKSGYRLIDTASLYDNEESVGKSISKSRVKREDLFVTTKVWNTERGYEKTKKAFEESINKLGLDYIDLYLIHWPANQKQYGVIAKKLNQDTWRALEDLYLEGRIKAIGVSNFLPHHIDGLLETARIRPMVNQIEYHPGWPQIETLEYCKKHDIVVEGWSPFGREAVLNNEVLIEIAKKYGKSVPQVCLRWAVQNGVVPLPKSSTPERMKENTDIFDFNLEDDDMDKITSLRNIGGKSDNPDEVDF